MSLTTLPLANARPAWLDQSEESARAWLEQHGQPPMRLKQIRRWVYAGRAESFAEMTDLPQGLRGELDAEFDLFATRVDQHLRSTDGTHKLLLRLPDGGRIESVLIPEGDRRTACVSTQVGCAMGCVFCATGIDGVDRNLRVGEILEQLLRLRNLTEPAGRLSHVVVMGMGEPLANLDNLMAALEVATRKDGLGIGARHVTISTVGLPAKIRQLAASGKQYHLAVSLHAPDDALRTRIVPTNSKTGMDEILKAADEFYSRTGRQVTYEYVLLGGVNDSPAHARALAGLLAGRQAHVNLIPFNDVDGLPYRRPDREAVVGFTETLRRHRVSTKVRKRKGADIDAACGQLRRVREAGEHGRVPPGPSLGRDREPEPSPGSRVESFGEQAGTQ